MQSVLEISCLQRKLKTDISAPLAPKKEERYIKTGPAIAIVVIPRRKTPGTGHRKVCICAAMCCLSPGTTLARAQEVPIILQRRTSHMGASAPAFPAWRDSMRKRAFLQGGRLRVGRVVCGRYKIMLLCKFIEAGTWKFFLPLLGDFKHPLCYMGAT